MSWSRILDRDNRVLMELDAHLNLLADSGRGLVGIIGYSVRLNHQDEQWHNRWKMKELLVIKRSVSRYMSEEQ